MPLFAGLAIVIVAIIIAIVAVVAGWGSRYRKVGPEEALIISGRSRHITVAGPDGNPMRKRVGYRIVTNGAAFIVPFLEKVQSMSLRVISVNVETRGAQSIDGVPITVSGQAMFKVGSTDEMIGNAAERYLGVPMEEIEQDVRDILEGFLRGVCATLTPEQIYKDRIAFQTQIQQEAESDLRSLGIQLDTLTLREIGDEHGYYEALGRTRTAEVQRDARRGQAEANRDADIAEANARLESERRKAEVEAEIASAQKERDVKQAQFKSEVAQESARTEQAGPRSSAEAEQEVVRAQTNLQLRREEERRAQLDATSVADADANRKIAIIQAEGQADAARRKAEGEADAMRASAEARRDARQAEASGESDYIKQTGHAEADAIEAKLTAEAEGLRSKAGAMREFTDATMQLEIAKEAFRILPEIVRAAVDPLSHVDSIKIVDFGGSGHNGAAGSGSPLNKLLDISPKALMTAGEVIRETTGWDLNAIISNPAQFAQVLRDAAAKEADKQGD